MKLSRGISLFLLAMLALWAVRGSAVERPDIVLIMSDDMGFSDLGCYGGEIATPHLDSLASQGVRFMQFYNGARCCPTRAQLLTGLYAHQAGIGFMEPTNSYNKPFKHIPEYQGFLNRQCVTLAEVLRSAGYQTMMAGKWHVGAQPSERPLDRGFDRFFGLYGGACSFFFPREGQIIDQDRPFWPLPEDFYTTDYFARYAAKFVREAAADQPFFLYLSFTAPHWPLHAWPDDIARYRGKYRDDWRGLREKRFARQKELGLFAADARLSPLHPDAENWTTETADDMDLRMAVYAAMIDRMDQGIGQVLAALRETGREENTLVMFLNDNGACAEPIGKGQPDRLPADHPRSFQGVLLPWANASNTPFRQFKHWTHEGGIATPFIARWPNRIPAGVINRKQVSHVIDLMPTVVELAGAEFPREILLEHPGPDPDRPLLRVDTILPPEGQSLVAALCDPDHAVERSVFWEHEGNRAVRRGRWKLVAYYNENLGDTNVALGKRSGRWELYDLENDRTESNDLARVHPEKVEELSALHRAWEKRIGVCDWQSLLNMGGLDEIPER